jgi:hypothetical protein
VSVAVNALHDRVRRAIGDYPAFDVTTSAPNTAAATFTSANTAAYQVGQTIAIDQEQMFVTAVGATSISVTRGWRGSTAASHATSTPVLLSPQFGPQDILDALNEGLRAIWPYFFKWVEDETVSTTSDLQADYAMPTAFGESGLVTDMEILMPGLTNDGWRGFRWFRHLRGANGNTISLVRIPPVGTKIRMKGLAPFNQDLAYGNFTDIQLIDSGVPALVIYAQHYLLQQREANRVVNTKAANLLPAGAPAGQNVALSQFHYQRFISYCQAHQQRYPKWRTRRAM